MAKEKPTTKTCKHCKTEIPYDAKVCPQCRKKQGSGCLTKILIGIVVIILIGVIGGMMGGEDEGGSTSKESGSTEEKKIEYEICTVADMVDLLDQNAAKAAKTYEDKYLEVTGILNNIDSDGAYITLYADEYDFIGVQCYTTTDEQKEQILDLSTGDKVTVKGQCTDVGEVLGYSLDIDSIE